MKRKVNTLFWLFLLLPSFVISSANTNVFEILTSVNPPMNQSSVIFEDNYNIPPGFLINESLYTIIQGDWWIENGSLIGNWSIEDWKTCTANVSFPLQDIIISFDYEVLTWYPGVSLLSFELTSGPSGRRFIDFYEDGTVYYSNRVSGEPEYQLPRVISPLPLSGHVVIYIDQDTGFSVNLNGILVAEFNLTLMQAGNIGFGTFNSKVAFDNLLIRHGSQVPVEVASNAITLLDSGQALGSAASTGVALGDIDGDGDLDAVETNYNQANRVWLNDGTGIFSDSGQVLGSSSSTDVAIADVDVDGDLDIVVANENGQANTFWVNNGAGTFSLQCSFGSSDSTGVAIGDLDLDGDRDVFIVNDNNQPDRAWYMHDMKFSDTGLSLGNSASADIALADLDLDGDCADPEFEPLLGCGDLDAVVVTRNDQENTLWINLAERGYVINFQDSCKNFGSSNSTGVALGELDGNWVEDSLDIFVVNYNQPNKVWVNDGTGAFDLMDTGQALGNSASTDVALGDVDGDGDLDAVVANEIGQANSLWVNDGAGVFSLGDSFGFSSSTGVALGDLDGDGDLDAFIVNNNQANKVWLASGVIINENVDDFREGSLHNLEIMDNRNLSLEIDQSTYRHIGLFESKITSLGDIHNIRGDFSWNPSTQPAGTLLQIQIGLSNTTSYGDFLCTSYYSSNFTFGGTAKYLKYHVYFESDGNQLLSPFLENITMNYFLETVSGAPQGLSAIGGSSSVILTWSAPGDSGGSAITHYNIYRGIGRPIGTYAFLGTSKNTKYTDSEICGQCLVYGGYIYVVTAVNSVGESGYSNEVECYPGPAVTTTTTTTVTAIATTTTTTTTVEETTEKTTTAGITPAWTIVILFPVLLILPFLRKNR